MIKLEKIYVVLVIIPIIIAAHLDNEDCKCWPGYVPDFEESENKALCIKLWRKRKFVMRFLELPNFIECNVPELPMRPLCKCTGGSVVMAYPEEWCESKIDEMTSKWACENLEERDRFDKEHPEE
ncbi:uncharacterized protein LOC130891371 [Diorhabda carinulata]|uniref:uncharacterized protein LOC130891371 n=1 Tax=Diorhabda carinulata TaxID=1163345 RepID=UPI0025A193E4|nr:uncharacterized protein LOC130891371 [Diorhabda carinulata]